MVFLELLNPTWALNISDVLNVPLIESTLVIPEVARLTRELIELYSEDWNNGENSFEFSKLAWIHSCYLNGNGSRQSNTLEEDLKAWHDRCWHIAKKACA